jgi:hypothetical protein
VTRAGKALLLCFTLALSRSREENLRVCAFELFFGPKISFCLRAFAPAHLVFRARIFALLVFRALLSRSKLPEDRQNRTSRTGQAQQDGHNRKYKTGQAQQARHNRKEAQCQTNDRQTGHAELDRQNRTSRTEKEEYDKQNRSGE